MDLCRGTDFFRADVHLYCLLEYNRWFRSFTICNARRLVFFAVFFSFFLGGGFLYEVESGERCGIKGWLSAFWRLSMRY